MNASKLNGRRRLSHASIQNQESLPRGLMKGHKEKMVIELECSPCRYGSPALQNSEEDGEIPILPLKKKKKIL